MCWFPDIHQPELTHAFWLTGGRIFTVCWCSARDRAMQDSNSFRCFPRFESGSHSRRPGRSALSGRIHERTVVAFRVNSIRDSSFDLVIRHLVLKGVGYDSVQSIPECHDESRPSKRSLCCSVDIPCSPFLLSNHWDAVLHFRTAVHYETDRASQEELSPLLPCYQSKDR